MGNLQSVTDLTRLVQDVQYTTALRGMTETEKQNYFDTQKQELLGDILKDREGTFQKTFVDANRNNSIQHSLFFYQQRNRDLQNMGDILKNQNESAIGTTKFNNQLATRQYEINEWTYNNKLDTLFVFQILFVTLVLTASLAYIHRMGDHCGSCRYNVKKRTGLDACPFNSLYWAFIARHRTRLAGNHRMQMILRSWDKMDASVQQDLVSTAESFLEGLD
jgi:hypothetical protein